MASSIGRTLLFVPGDCPKRIGKALASSASSVAIDFEDAVSEAAKEAARSSAVAALAQVERPGVYVRINGLDTSWAAGDLEAVAGVLGALAGVIVPKVEVAGRLRQVDEFLEGMEARAGLPRGGRVSVPIIETARGVIAAAEIAGASRVGGVIFGTLDLAAELGVTPSIDGRELLHARSQVVLAAAAARVDAIDGPYPALGDTEGLARSSTATRLLGFAGRVVIHPCQLDIVHEAFSPSASELCWAKTVLATYREAGLERRGALRASDGTFLDRPVVTRAARLLGVDVADVAW